MDFIGQDNTIWYVLGGVLVIYLLILFQNRRRNKRRKDRKFMDSSRRFDR